jgi:hypothetical protein
VLFHILISHIHYGFLFFMANDTLLKISSLESRDACAKKIWNILQDGCPLL